MNPSKDFDYRIKKGNVEDCKYEKINADWKYVTSMVNKLKELIDNNKELSFNELDKLVEEDEDLNEFATTQTSIYLILARSTSPDRFKNVYSLIDLKRKVSSGEISPIEAYNAMQNCGS